MCGSIGVVCALVCVLVTVTTTVVHMSRLQGLRECIYTEIARYNFILFLSSFRPIFFFSTRNPRCNLDPARVTELLKARSRVRVSCSRRLRTARSSTVLCTIVWELSSACRWPVFSPASSPACFCTSCSVTRRKRCTGNNCNSGKDSHSFFFFWKGIFRRNPSDNAITTETFLIHRVVGAGPCTVKVEPAPQGERPEAPAAVATIAEVPALGGLRHPAIYTHRIPIWHRSGIFLPPSSFKRTQSE